MTSTETLWRRKGRLSRRLDRRDDRHYQRRGLHARLPERRLLRARLYRIDLLLEARGELTAL